MVDVTARLCDTVDKSPVACSSPASVVAMRESRTAVDTSRSETREGRSEMEASVMKVLGVSDRRQVWHYRDLSKKLLRVFGKFRGLWRAHAGFSEVIQRLADGDAMAPWHSAVRWRRRYIR